MPSNRPNQARAGTGFAGLSGLVSNVDDLIERSIGRAQIKKSGASAASASGTSESRPRSPRVFTAPAPSSGNARWMWWGAGAVLLLLWLIGVASSDSETPTTTRPARSSATQNPFRDDQSSLAEPAATVTEQIPPLGIDRVLGEAQIRYCLSEDVRLEAARSIVTGDAEVSRFNAMIEDFNTRCSNYRYHRDEFDAVQRQVQSNQLVLRAQGVARFRP